MAACDGEPASLGGILASSFYGKRKESTGMRVIEEIPAGSSDSESNSNEDQEVIFSQHEIEAVNEGNSDEEDEEMDRSCPIKDSAIELDMAPDSVDDMYDGCKEQMKKKNKGTIWSKVLNLFRKKEDSNFKKAWKMAKNDYRPPTTLEKEQAMAINVYTREDPKVYLDFNKAVRTQKSQYKTKFKYPKLHFFLTDALQTLKPERSDTETCPTVYRRSKSKFRVPDEEFRFGSFTSGSKDDYLRPEVFGEESCFEIVTCHGADISEYSKLPGEREVLIPPYEVFKVTEIKKRSEQRDLPCKVVYKVESTGKMSNTNCALSPKSSSSRCPRSSGSRERSADPSVRDL